MLEILSWFHTRKEWISKAYVCTGEGDSQKHTAAYRMEKRSKKWNFFVYVPYCMDAALVCKYNFQNLFPQKVQTQNTDLKIFNDFGKTCENVYQFHIYSKDLQPKKIQYKIYKISDKLKKKLTKILWITFPYF